MIQHITIAGRFCGPPSSANGGYVCGLIDKYTPYVSEVTLRKPPPLNRPLRLRLEAGHAELEDGDLLIASARPGAVGLAGPPPPSFRQAQKAAKKYLGFQGHPFPTCFVCGPERRTGDGLHIFAGRIGDGDLFASPWIPDTSLADDRGLICTEFLWAVLDCPGAFALMGNQPKPLVLGRMTANITGALRPGEECVAAAWPTGREGRKYYCGSAIYKAQGELCALAEATWLELRV